MADLYDDIYALAFPDLSVEERYKLPSEREILDGEGYVLDKDGKPVFPVHWLDHPSLYSREVIIEVGGLFVKIEGEYSHADGEFDYYSTESTLVEQVEELITIVSWKEIKE